MPTPRLSFGPFEFDSPTRELRREGELVRLQAQPSQVLAALLAQPGEVVSRETLRQAVWGAGTHVDFESGLNFCIAQIRSALGDSAEAPVYIRTIPKRGYQFIGPVTSLQALPKPPVPSRRALIPVLGAGALAAAGWYAWSRIPPKPVRIAVARFQNQSGDPTLDHFTEGLSDALTAELTTAAPGVLAVIGNAPILRQPRGFQDLVRISTELQAGLVVLGQVQRQAGQGRVLLHLIRMPDQAHLWVTRVDNPDFSSALQTQSAIARRATREFLAKLQR
ncbi:winged helix-turn-helix domain-containing protein [Paludibaculum fermentans]|uniref:winged helix-turn-helix domain-containing protein n=1 Tax=Paludibaculum fermentans TaxID=1473598 RepID=UPI003EBBC153